MNKIDQLKKKKEESSEERTAVPIHNMYQPALETEQQNNRTVEQLTDQTEQLNNRTTEQVNISPTEQPKRKKKRDKDEIIEEFHQIIDEPKSNFLHVRIPVHVWNKMEWLRTQYSFKQKKLSRDKLVAIALEEYCDKIYYQKLQEEVKKNPFEE